MPHGAVVVSEADFQAIFEAPATASPAPTASPSSAVPLATIHAAAPFPAGDILRFGQRGAVAAPVTLAPQADRATAMVEAVGRGWLFLIPAGESNAWVLGVGGPLARLLEDSCLIAPHIIELGAPSPPFETAQRQLPLLAGQHGGQSRHWLACGTAAIGFDPICGDGSAQAVREAVLGAAVIAAIARGEPAAPLLTHYHSMLTASLRRHIQLSGQFYASGGTGPWWQQQVADLARAYGWCTAQLAQLPEPRYVLQEFDLYAKEPAA